MKRRIFWPVEGGGGLAPRMPVNPPRDFSRGSKVWTRRVQEHQPCEIKQVDFDNISN